MFNTRALKILKAFKSNRQLSFERRRGARTTPDLKFLGLGEDHEDPSPVFSHDTHEIHDAFGDFLTSEAPGLRSWRCPTAKCSMRPPGRRPGVGVAVARGPGAVAAPGLGKCFELPRNS